MKSRYISNEQMNRYLQKGRRERSQALTSAVSALMSSVKNIRLKPNTHLEKSSSKGNWHEFATNKTNKNCGQLSN